MAKIGIDARLTHYRIGGISTYIRQLITSLEAENTKHDLIIFQSRKSNDLLSNHFQSRRLWTPSHHRLERIALSLELTPYNLDIFHTTDFIPPQFGAKFHVITVHDLTFLHYPQHKDAEALRYYNNQIEYAVRHADHILAVSQATKNDLIQMLNVPETKITIQPHGTGDQFRILDAVALDQQKLHLNLPDKYILTVGTFEPRKNIPTLLSAYEGLPKEIREQYALLLVGQSGWLFEETMKQIHQMQKSGFNIILRSDITDEQLPVVYNLASVLVLPSYYEGFGLPILEAMACGTPVISSNTFSLAEVVGDAGLVFAPEDTLSLSHQLEWVLTDNDCYRDLQNRGLQRVKQFTWRRSAQIALSVYDSLGR